jgi:hypothetical protein
MWPTRRILPNDIEKNLYIIAESQSSCVELYEDFRQVATHRVPIFNGAS